MIPLDYTSTVKALNERTLTAKSLFSLLDTDVQELIGTYGISPKMWFREDEPVCIDGSIIMTDRTDRDGSPKRVIGYGHVPKGIGCNGDWPMASAMAMVAVLRGDMGSVIALNPALVTETARLLNTRDEAVDSICILAILLGRRPSKDSQDYGLSTPFEDDGKFFLWSTSSDTLAKWNLKIGSDRVLAMRDAWLDALSDFTGVAIPLRGNRGFCNKPRQPKQQEQHAVVLALPKPTGRTGQLVAVRSAGSLGNDQLGRALDCLREFDRSGIHPVSGKKLHGAARQTFRKKLADVIKQIQSRLIREANG